MGRGTRDIFPYVKDLLNKPVVVDGYCVYTSLFDIIQRCWTHILRDGMNVCVKYKDDLYYENLLYKLRAIFKKAKEIAKATAKDGGGSMDICNELADEVRAVAAEYGKDGFAGTLTNAADNLFTFLRYPGMPPTNNNPELMVRDYIVPQRNVRRKFMSQIGMAVFVVLESFTSTCDLLGLSVGSCLGKILDYPLYNIYEEYEPTRPEKSSDSSNISVTPAPDNTGATPPEPTNSPGMPALPAPGDICATPPAPNDSSGTSAPPDTSEGTV